MILVDTSAWIDFFAGHNLPRVTPREQFILDNEDLAMWHSTDRFSRT